jgi:hypothetical protein
MANWQRTLDLLPEWSKALDDELAVQQLAAVVATRLRALTPFSDEDIESKRIELAEEFEDLSKDESADGPEFDWLMNTLYDWGDTPLDPKFNGKKVCWIKTF